MIQIIGGGTPSKRTAAFWGGTVPWVSPKDMKSDVISTSEDKITKEAIENSATKWVPRDATLVVVRSGILARTVPICIAGCDLTINQDLKALVPDEAVNSRYLFLFLKSREPELLASVTSSATVHRITTVTLESLEIPLPSLDEQQRIVAKLDQAFAALDRARDCTEANLGDTFTLFDSVADELSQAQNVGWEAGTFGDLVGEVFTGPFGSLLHKKDYVEGGIPIINPSNIVGGRIEPDWSKTVSPDAAERLRAYTLREGDLVIGRRGEMGRCASVSAEADGWLCGTGSFFLRPKPNVSTELVAYLMRTPTLVDRLTGIATGATMLNLSNRALTQMPFELPAYDTQLDLLDKFKALEARTSALRSRITAKLSDITALRQSLLQQAFSGQLT